MLLDDLTGITPELGGMALFGRIVVRVGVGAVVVLAFAVKPGGAPPPVLALVAAVFGAQGALGAAFGGPALAIFEG